jgi:hypothetical protein
MKILNIYDIDPGNYALVVKSFDYYFNGLLSLDEIGLFSFHIKINIIHNL